MEALARLSAVGCKLIVLTNQSPIGRGLVSAEVVDVIHRRLGPEAKRHRADIRASEADGVREH
jgi:histidinol phosphatase-like enzyme